jgi:hypothetical protein
MKRAILIAVVLVSGLSLLAQQSAPPDIITSQTNAAVALGAYKAWAENQISSLWAAQQTAQADIAALKSAPHITEYTIEMATGSGGAWALNSTESELYGTRRIVSFQNAHQFRLCYNLGGGAGNGASMHLDESYDWAPSVPGTWVQILGPIDISPAWQVACTPWTPYTGTQTDAFIRILGSAPNPGTAQFMSIALQVQ